jgi:hypothetical protein
MLSPYIAAYAAPNANELQRHWQYAFKGKKIYGKGLPFILDLAYTMVGRIVG